MPSFPSRLGCPDMPNDCFAKTIGPHVWPGWFLSLMFSINPAPNVGVGMRKLTLFNAKWCAKSGCFRAQVPASDRAADYK